MGRMAPTYSQAQREALYSLTLDEGQPVRLAVGELAAGVDGAEPLEMPDSTAYELVARERERREATLSESDRIAEFVKRAIAALDRELTAIESACARGEAMDWTSLNRLLGSLKRVALIHRPVGAEPPPRFADSGPIAADRLLEAHRAGSAAEASGQ